MQKLVEAKPKYDKGIHAMRMLMKHKNTVLDSPKESELTEAFNSEMSEILCSKTVGIKPLRVSVTSFKE